MSMKPSNISISRILMISYGIVIALFALSIAVALYGVHANASMTKEFYNRPYMVSKSAVALRFTIEEMSTYVEQLLNAENDAAKQKALVAIEDLTEQRMNELNVVRSLFKADPDLLERFSNACDELGARRNAVIGAAEAGDINRAIDLYSNEYLAQKEVTVNLSTEVVNTAEHVAQAFVKDSFSVEVGTSLAIGLLGTAAIVLVIVMWRRITHSIAAPIQEIDRIAKRLADGDLTVRSSCTSGNELGSLASSMNETVASLRFATEQVARSSSQMSDSSQAVAQGSAEQATAIEELAANVQSITHVVGENTESVLTVNSNTSDVLGAVEESSDSIARTVCAIEEIKDNAQSISQLANSIEDISFQTNILALNASVEAARAGDAGRGFAIVAEEIRRLASQVSEASRAADELAGRAIENVEAGSELIGSASSNMEEAVTSIEDIKTAMSSIAHASEQQLEAVAQIQESMDSLSQVVQENSAASEESAVIGEELADRANELKHLIGRFKIDADPHESEAGA